MNNKSNDSILLNKNGKTNLKQTKTINENTNSENDSNTNKTFCNANSQIKQGFEFSQVKLDSENSSNFNNNSNKGSIQQSYSNNSDNNINIFKFNDEEGSIREEENEQINAKIMLKSKYKNC